MSLVAAAYAALLPDLALAAQPDPRATRSPMIVDAKALAAFKKLQAEIPGREGVAIVTYVNGKPIAVELGDVRTGVAWSTSKVPVAMALYARNGGRVTAQMKSAITMSDNTAALGMWSSLGGGETAAARAEQQLRLAGDTQTQVQGRVLRAGFTPFGQTQWRLADQAQLAASMPCMKSGPAVLRLMDNVTRSQQWGLGTINSGARFKGGWGPGVRPGKADGYLVRQFGLVTIGKNHYGISIAAQPANGSFGTGAQSLTRISGWASRYLPKAAFSTRSGCISR